MKCPACRNLGNTVIWTRASELNATKRRRLCSRCGARWTTTEIVDLKSVAQDIEPGFSNKELAERWKRL